MGLLLSLMLFEGEGIQRIRGEEEASDPNKPTRSDPGGYLKQENRYKRIQKKPEKERTGFGLELKKDPCRIK